MIYGSLMAKVKTKNSSTEILKFLKKNSLKISPSPVLKFDKESKKNLVIITIISLVEFVSS